MGTYAPLLAFLKSWNGHQLQLPFTAIEKQLGRSLPESARKYPAFWSIGNHMGKMLAEAGWRASLLLSERAVSFIRICASKELRSAPGARSNLFSSSPVKPDVVLIGCVKEKRRGRHRAEDLFTSTLFKGRAAYAKSTGKPWFVLSAKHGLLAPDDVIDYYDVSLKDQPLQKRKDWSREVLARVEERFGLVTGKTVEIHAGSAYRDSGLTQGLRDRGANVVVPLEHLRQGEQLSWYARLQNLTTPHFEPRKTVIQPQPKVAAVETARVSAVVEKMTREFMKASFDLSARPGAPPCGWDGIPEMKLAKQLKAEGVTAEALRIILTLGVTMDRARDADRLWDSVGRLFEESPWAFDPALIRAASPERLRKALVETGVSQRHTKDVEAWYRVGSAMVNPDSPTAFRKVIHEGKGDYDVLVTAMGAKMSDGLPWFPLLSGPKIQLVWLRILAEPGGAEIEGLGKMPVAVDVQVRKVTEYLGVTSTFGQELNSVRSHIQQVWHEAVGRAQGPAHIAGTGAALDPVIWFFGKWGCTFCERVGKKLPISSLCTSCGFDEIRLGSLRESPSQKGSAAKNTARLVATWLSTKSETEIQQVLDAFGIAETISPQQLVAAARSWLSKRQ